MIKSEKITYYHCDHPGCQEVSWLGKGWDWKMCEVVFGTHPKIIKQRYEEGKATTVIQQYFHFCRAHAPVYEEILYALMARTAYLTDKQIIGDAFFREGLGCWITIHNCLANGIPIRNFQMDHETLSWLYEKFPVVQIRNTPLEDIKRLRELPYSADL